jgi:transcriptional regulator with XRE-family HTH domain
LAGADMAKTIYRDEYRVLLSVLRDARERSGLTQADIARHLEKPQSTVSHMEGGSRRVDVIEVIDYCNAVGSDPLDAFRSILARVGPRLGKVKRRSRA